MKDASNRIIEEFDCLLASGCDCIASRTWPERVVFYVVSARCEKDINGFASVYEQLLTAPEIRILIEGLDQIDEGDLAADFRRGLELLEANGFHNHTNWKNISDTVTREIEAIGDRVGDRLWNLDEKLASLLDGSEK